MYGATLDEADTVVLLEMNNNCQLIQVYFDMTDTISIQQKKLDKIYGTKPTKCH